MCCGGISCDFGIGKHRAQNQRPTRVQLISLHVMRAAALQTCALSVERTANIQIDETHESILGEVGRQSQHRVASFSRDSLFKWTCDHATLLTMRICHISQQNWNPFEYKYF